MSFFADGCDHDLARPRARIDVSKRALAEKGRATLRREHVARGEHAARRLPGEFGQDQRHWRLTVGELAEALGNRDQYVHHRLAALARLAALLHCFHAGRIHLRVAAWIAVQVVARTRQAEKQRREQGARRAADRAQNLARRELQRGAEVERLDVAPDAAQRLEAADQVEHVIAVADRLVENHDLVRMLLD
jgi:hypothetical protein